MSCQIVNIVFYFSTDLTIFIKRALKRLKLLPKTELPNTINGARGAWSNRLAFILAATGSAVGLGNIWKFPYITGENGGGAFVLVYLCCIALIGIPLMIAEVLIGRRGNSSPTRSFQTLAADSGQSRHWGIVGTSGIMASFLILSFYSVIGGWALAYLFYATTAGFSGYSVEIITDLFDKLLSDPLAMLFWHTVFMQSIIFLFQPDFSKLSTEGVLTALGHAFFTLSLGMSTMVVYGSYLPKHISITNASVIVSILDTVVALMVGVAIFSIVFSNGLEPGQGPGLIFKTIPLAFNQITGGYILGIVFFFLLVFAAWSSAISLLEPPVARIMDNNISRPKATLLAAGLAWVMGITCLLSFNYWSELQLIGSRHIFDSLDYLTTNIMLPLTGLGVAFFCGWTMKKSETNSELLHSSKHWFAIWHFLIRYLVPALVLIVFIYNIY
jgi:NSS family neurotransmitter:Na+ symporter